MGLVCSRGRSRRHTFQIDPVVDDLDPGGLHPEVGCVLGESRATDDHSVGRPKDRGLDPTRKPDQPSSRGPEVWDGGGRTQDEVLYPEDERGPGASCTHEDGTCKRGAQTRYDAQQNVGASHPPRDVGAENVVNDSS